MLGIDIVSIVRTFGYIGVAAIVFTESGLLIGAFFPGDSLLFTAGFLASQNQLHIIPLILIAFIAAVSGDNVGYWLGKRFGPSVFTRNNHLLLDQAHIARAERYYEEHGPVTIVLARFMPVVRTIAPVLAGVGSMKWRIFFTYNIIGALLWAVGVPLIGFWLGSSVPNADKYIIPIVIVIMGLSAVPPFYRYIQSRRAKI